MATEIGEPYDTVRKWYQRGRIPEWAWGRIIEKAARRQFLVTPEKLLELNGEIPSRGRRRLNA